MKNKIKYLMIKILNKDIINKKNRIIEYKEDIKNDKKVINIILKEINEEIK